MKAVITPLVILITTFLSEPITIIVQYENGLLIKAYTMLFNFSFKKTKRKKNFKSLIKNGKHILLSGKYLLNNSSTSYNYDALKKHKIILKTHVIILLISLTIFLYSKTKSIVKG